MLAASSNSDYFILPILQLYVFQVLLGLLGVLLVMLSVLGSVGFFSAIGVKSTLIIMEVIPFLVLAVSLYVFIIIKFIFCSIMHIQ